MNKGFLSISAVALAVVSAEATTFGKLTPVTLKADAQYDVATERYATYPIATLPAYSFDCSQTNGWTIYVDNGNKRCKVIPDVNGGARYLTSDLNEINHTQYHGTYELWYSGWKNIKGPIYRTSDGVLKGPYLDFGSAQSYWCSFFNTVSGDTRENRMTSVGTVIGVYKPSATAAGVSSGVQVAGGQLLGGNDFQRHNGYDVNVNKGVTRAEPILKTNVAASNAGGTLWKNLQRNNLTYTYWSTGWQVVALNPSTATLEAYGAGVGNCENVDFSLTNGGQSIAELMVFQAVLSEEDLVKVIKYLMQKWLPDVEPGLDGAGRASSFTIDGPGENPSAGHTVSVDVPEGETLTVDALRGGRGSTAPKFVKTGAGQLTLNEASDFGGEVELNGGSLTVGRKPVPTLAKLPKDMTIRLDASDTSSMTLDGDAVTDWANLLGSTRAVAASAEGRALKPTLVPDVLGTGLNVVDFGSRSDGTGAYLTWSGAPKFATVIAVVDARIQAGGHLLEDPFYRGNHYPMGRRTGWNAVFYKDANTRAIATTWVNGRAVDSTVAGYDAPTWQVVAMRVPATEATVKYLGAHKYGDNPTWDAGGFRLGELIAYDRSLGDEEVRDVTAYLMKKWLGRSPAGYAPVKADLADLQNVVAASGTEIDVPDGKTMTIANLRTTTGPAVKTGGGQLVIGPGSNLAGGLSVREGTIAMGEADVASASEVAAEPFLHLDATASSHFDVLENGTNFVAAWESLNGRSGAYKKDANNTTDRMPFLNENDLLNGHPVVDFGPQYGWANNGSYMMVTPEPQNVRAAYVVYGSQEKGGQIFGSYSPNYKDFNRPAGGSVPSATTPLFAGADAALANGEIYTNGVRIAQAEARTFPPTGGYQLIEVHTTAGLRFTGLGVNYGGGHFLYGGCRLGEVIVYEHPLSEREKVATRNYLLNKWFPASPLTPLPAKTLTPLTGSIAYQAGTTWNVSVGTTGVESGEMAVSGTLSFAAGTTLNLTGLGTLGDLKNRKLRIAKAESYSGLDNLTIAGDVAFTSGTRPRFAVSPSGELFVRFGNRGFVMVVR